jgi:hypothetical protein
MKVATTARMIRMMVMIRKFAAIARKSHRSARRG